MSDRFRHARQGGGYPHLSQAFLSELHSLRIDLFLHQQGLDTRTPAGKAMFQMMGVFAKFERAIIQERVRAGLARAKSEGKRLGRPRIARELEERIRKALAKRVDQVPGDPPGHPRINGSHLSRSRPSPRMRNGSHLYLLHLLQTNSGPLCPKGLAHRSAAS
jgi:hypothetical protein